MNLNIFPLRSLKSRVTLFTLAIFVISIWLLGLYSSRMLHDGMERMLGEQQFSTVSIVAADINRELDFRLRSLEKITEGISQSELGNPPALQRLLENRPLLEKLFNGGFFVTQIDGTAIASVPRSANRVGINYMERDHVISALKQGKTTASSPVMGKMLHAPVFSMAAPIKDAKQNIIGCLVGVIDLSKPNFLNNITENRYGKTGGYILIAPKQRLVVTATDKNRTMKLLPPPGINPLFDQYMLGYEGSGTVVDSSGLSVLSSAKQIPAAGWFLVARIPTEEVFAPVNDMHQRILFATILLTLLAGGLTWWMLKRQLLPLFTTSEILATMSETAQPFQPLPVGRQDEIGRLIGAFNNLLETLGQREKELQGKNAELERFTYTVSHDLKSPVITIKGFTGSLQKDLLNGRYERMVGDLKRVSDAADKMNNLLRDLLALSTIGHVVNKKETVDMNLLADDVLAQLYGSLKNKNLSVQVKPALPSLFCDRARMAEVLQNLIENALHYMGEQPKPEILFGMREEDGVNVFFVQDNGIGIDERYHQLIFGLFNKLDAKSGGTGIGLALVKRIIEVHCGKIWVESEGIGKGSRFCFTVGGQGETPC